MYACSQVYQFWKRFINNLLSFCLFFAVLFKMIKKKTYFVIEVFVLLFYTQTKNVRVLPVSIVNRNFKSTHIHQKQKSKWNILSYLEIIM